MPRHPRGHTPEAVLHLISRGVDKRDIFRINSDYQRFLAQLREALRSHEVSLFAYCLMPNHFHLLVGVGSVPVGDAMHQVLTRYSIHFNHAYERVGHLFQSRYKSYECRDIAYLIQLITYIHMNPVRAGLANTPEDWAWSSHREFAAGDSSNLDLVRLAETAEMSSKELYERYVERIIEATAPEDDPSLQGMIRRAAISVGIMPEELLAGRRGGPFTQAKRVLIKTALSRGYTLMDVAGALGCARSSLVELMV